MGSTKQLDLAPRGCSLAHQIGHCTNRVRFASWLRDAEDVPVSSPLARTGAATNAPVSAGITCARPRTLPHAGREGVQEVVGCLLTDTFPGWVAGGDGHGGRRSADRACGI